MPTTNPSPVAQQWFDNNGNPLNGGKIFTFQAGTSTPLASYTDSTGTVTNANPVILDSAGRGSVWLGPSSYKIIVQTSAGVQLYSQDNVPGNGLFNGPLYLTEAAAPSGVSSNDILYADSTAHRLKMNNNNAGVDTVVGAATTDTLTNKTLTSPVINGTPTGTGIPTVTLKSGTGAGNYTSASTSYVRVDSTNLAYTVTIPTGWKLAVTVAGSICTQTAAVAHSFALADGSGDNTGILVEGQNTAANASQPTPFALTTVINGDGASHTINLQYKTSNGADSVLIANSGGTIKPTMTFILTPSN